MELQDGSSGCPRVTEQLVATLWDNQRSFRLPLVTVEGKQIQVVYRGRRRWDRGPDFAGALIAWEGTDLRAGDVEVHVRSSDWRAHKHDKDHHYNRVLLQVVMWHDSREPSMREDGLPVSVVALAPHLAAPLETLLSTAQQGLEAPHSLPCRQKALDDELLGSLLDWCGADRFDEKVARFESDLTCKPPDQLLYESVAAALGYAQNREPFRRLAELLPVRLLRVLARSRALDNRSAVQVDAEALLLGMAGLLPSQRGLIANEDSHVRALEERWAASELSLEGGAMQAGEWQFFRVRPANFPTRRVAALSWLAAQWPLEGLGEALASLVRLSEPKRVPTALESLLLGSDRDGYWARHCDFGLPLRCAADLIGRQRAAEIVINVFLPYLVAWASFLGDEVLACLARQAFAIYPKRGDNEIARYMAAFLVGHPRPHMARSGCRQQGLLQLYWRWCEAKQCGECPIRLHTTRAGADL